MKAQHSKKGGLNPFSCFLIIEVGVKPMKLQKPIRKGIKPNIESVEFWKNYTMFANIINDDTPKAK